MNRQTIYSVMVGLVLAAGLIASSAAAQGQGPPPGKGPGGGEETLGNNLSVPAVFVPDLTGAPTLRIACADAVTAVGPTGPQSTVYPGYWLQKTEATWSAECATDSTAEVTADWGDNLTKGKTLPAGKPIRVEVGLLDLSATGRTGYVITNLTPDLEDRLATYGTNGDPFTTGDTGAPATRVWDQLATLLIEEVNTGDIVYDGVMTAEINSMGAVVYGYNWGVQGKKFAPQPGKYRLTFFTNNTTIIGIADTAALNPPGWDGGSTWVEIELTPGKGGGGRP